MKLGTNDIGSVYLGTNEISKVYLGTNLVWENAFDVDYQAILDYATTQGYTLPSAGQQALQNQLVIDLKAAGIWSKLDTFAVFATDGNSDFALIDWIRLSQYTAVNSPTFTTNEGFQGNGTSSYINTNYKPSTDAINMTLNSSSFNLYQRIDDSVGTRGHGCYLTPSGIYINAQDGPGFRSWNNSNGGTNGGVYSGAPSFISTNRISSTQILHINNGVNLSTRVFNSTSLPTRTILICASASGTGTTVADYGNHQISIASLGASLDSEKTNYYNSVNSYMTSI